MAASIILITAGAIFCLFGYALYRLWAAFTGLVIGLGAGLALGQFLGAEIWPVVAGTALGVALAGVFYYFQTAGAVMAGAGAGFVLATLILYTAGSSNWPLALLGAVFGGVFAGFFFQTFIVAGTAVGGGAGLVLGLYALFAGVDLYAFDFTAPPVTGAAAGMLLAAVVVIAAAPLPVRFPRTKSGDGHTMVRDRKMFGKDRLSPD